MSSLFFALAFVTLAEMGDKTQLLAMAFASKYSAKQVMIGVFIATIFNHGLAVALGEWLTTFIPLNTIQIIAAASFILFGLWTIRGDKLNGEEKRFSKYVPILSVTLAFFLAEIGDKTQLATISLAAKFQSPYFVLIGTTLGMLVADGIGIWAGAWLNQKFSTNTIKWFAAIIFILFGIIGLYHYIPESYSLYLNLFTFLFIVGLAYLMKMSSRKEKTYEV
ncbi:TMEM165/GDT1 family protein [Tepidibacillus fermentans]|uniref:GDT1 family protein n=1 Tax=Tepidibacillus fermentans TaxID=1281767 RepID=A0A4R3KJK8_9BACI|nr:TMEM165/GDT1 family protein [Tepidibacillus fermentans]TCS83702.1 putative Ca2+/H+ antiporter (TMEM165/GDT1 family) [Tepidibacillus fermentans]